MRHPKVGDAARLVMGKATSAEDAALAPLGGKNSSEAHWWVGVLLNVSLSPKFFVVFFWERWIGRMPNCCIFFLVYAMPCCLRKKNVNECSSLAVL